MKTCLVVIAMLLVAGPARAEEPVIGGRCEGCELVFSGRPDDIPSQARIAGPEVPGEPLVLEGTVRNQEGEPIEGIIVYAYHTNSGGVYPDGPTRHGALRGWARTDGDGHYRFDTIRPGGYPTGTAPQHVHMHVVEPGRATYYVDDVLFLDDPRLTAGQRRNMERGRGGSGVCDPVRDADGTWRVRRDITLGENVPGYDDLGPPESSPGTEASG